MCPSSCPPHPSRGQLLPWGDPRYRPDVRPGSLRLTARRLHPSDQEMKDAMTPSADPCFALLTSPRLKAGSCPETLLRSFLRQTTGDKQRAEAHRDHGPVATLFLGEAQAPPRTSERFQREGCLCVQKQPSTPSSATSRGRQVSSCPRSLRKGTEQRDRAVWAAVK